MVEHRPTSAGSHGTAESLSVLKIPFEKDHF